MLWLIIVIIVDWLLMLVVVMSHHGGRFMVRNSTGTVNYSRVPWMTAILDDAWVYVGIRMIHLCNLLVVIVR